ncbi:amino acid ABC transporter permease [Rhizobium leguminosarum bv. viciae]|uniref:ABC transporter permease subunit n=1 Tax=Rhizobium leguminosarum TaxID=384 RepID=A0A6P0CZV6_RHILE|nr:amino acid ABC transporter permease [Rhizobium leguminosarum]NKK53533.1 ABC transporter permease subunit [Rhizobium leguminosarum bv. viciae]TBY10241.1 amino acid ABC transporter permease [Rhizobium laguerreae]MBY5325153.1 amino acid ABC transporter permease [Rhizobium leguminosarum]MBY5345259.1 amino acid ABC transporter permease [Rhizobium leguminosarum]
MDWNIVWLSVPLLAKASVVTIQIAVLAGIAEIVFGIALGLVSLAQSRLIRTPVAIYVDVIRGTPLLIQIFFVYFVLPGFGIGFNEFWAGVTALGLNGAAFIAETVRGAVGSIEKGQSEAARSIGMREHQTLIWILLPQALRQIVPPTTNEVINLTKNTSLLSAISVFELTRSGQSIVSMYFAPLEVYGLLAIYYYVIVKALTVLSRKLENILPKW